MTSERRRPRPPPRSRARPDGGYRLPEVADRIARRGRWRDVAIEDTSTSERIDPRVLSTALDDLLPRERVVAIDSGNFMGYPSAYLAVPDELGYCMTQAFQSIGLGPGDGDRRGAGPARPLGGRRARRRRRADGRQRARDRRAARRCRWSWSSTTTPAYGAEVHHFGPHGHDLDTVVFPDTDLAAMARGIGFEAVTVRTAADLDAVGYWIAGTRSSTTARRRQGGRRPPVLVARGSLPRALSPRRDRHGHVPAP